jgi:hypothetical protein
MDGGGVPIVGCEPGKRPCAILTNSPTVVLMSGFCCNQMAGTMLAIGALGSAVRIV